jgi:tripartite-type tricarboxylate transporter receptor subunit TctC
MLTKRSVVSIFPVTMIVLSAAGVSSQDFPSKPLRIVTTSAGGSPDFVARIIADGISASVGQPAIVDNRPTGIIPGEIVSKAPPDGYTLLVNGSGFYIGPLLQKTPYDPVKDFSPIALTDRSPQVLALHPSVAANSVKELIALAKAKPGALNYSSGSAGGGNHLAAELFKAMAGVNIVRIPYKGGALVVTAVLGNEVQLTFASPNVVMPHFKTGRLKALAVTGLQPSPLAPGLPTIAASGLPGFNAVSNGGIFAPAKTPEAVIKRLNLESVRVLNRADIKQKFLDSGVEAVGSSPAEFAATMTSEIAQWGKVIKDAGIKGE